MLQFPTITVHVNGSLLILNASKVQPTGLYEGDVMCESVGSLSRDVILMELWGVFIQAGRHWRPGRQIQGLCVIDRQVAV